MRSHRRFSTVAALFIVSCSGPQTSPDSPTSPTVGSEHSVAVFEKGREASATSIAALSKLIESPDAGERSSAARALGIAANMGADKKPIEASLRGALEGETTGAVRASIYWGLGRAGSADSVDDLRVGVASENALEATEAALALGVFGRREIAIDNGAKLKLLDATASKDRDLRYAATYGLARQHNPPEDATVRRTLEALALDGDPEIRSTALTGLGRRKLGTKTLAAALPDNDWRASVAAVRGLLAIGTEEAHAALAEWARRDAPIRPHPMRVALEGFGGHDSNPHFERAAVRILGRLVPKNKLSLDEGQMTCLALAVMGSEVDELQGLWECAKGSVEFSWRAAVIAKAVISSPRVNKLAKIEFFTVLARSDDPRTSVTAVAPFAELAAGPHRKSVLDRFSPALEDKSAAVAGTAADELAKLELDATEAAPIHAALVARAEAELKSDGELGLTMVNAIAANSIISGARACKQAALHRNRTIRAAGGECLKKLGVALPSAPPIVWPIAPAPPAAANWIIETSRGRVVIELDPKTAPRHVAAVIKLTEAKFYDGLTFHRVVPDFVIQGGDPDGTGWGGPDFTIPAEPSPLPFDRGAVGIADAGPDTGGSQWFVMHSRAPHLEGRYTRIGQVTSGMEFVDAITVGDRIVSARIERSASAETPSP